MTKKRVKRLIREHVADLQKEIARRKRTLRYDNGKRLNVDVVTKVELNELLDFIDGELVKLIEVARILESAAAKQEG